ncbi:hypothetical protein D3C85_1142010 [compost metagenome]
MAEVLTVISLLAEKPPSSAVTVMDALPNPTPVTQPFGSTAATEASEVDQDTFLFVAFLGQMTAAINCVPPTANSTFE